MFIFGYAEEGKKFSEKYSAFLEILPKLIDTVNKVCTREFETRKIADHIVYYLGRICAEEDFCEILLMCQNGFGFGGLKLLRGFYERIVTMAYISKNPEEAEAFIGYNAINRWKEVCHAETARVDIGKFKSDVDNIKKQYKLVKNKYPKKSWSSLDIPAMALKSDREILPALYYVCYFKPTMHVHTTLYSILDRLNVGGDSGASYVISDKSAQREMVDTVLRNTHVLMLINLDIQNAFFALSLDDELTARVEDFMVCWGASC